MIIGRFKKQILFLILVVANTANAEYMVGGGTIHYVPAVTVFYSLESGQETLSEGQALDFSIQQTAMFHVVQWTDVALAWNIVWDGFSFGDVCGG